MNITTKPVEYFYGKQKCIGYVAWDESVASARPCVLVGHAWGGLDDFAQQQAVQMAALGYVGFVPDLYGDGATPDTVDDKMALMGPLKEDRKALLARINAGVKAACAMDEVDADNLAMIGFCFGGLATLDLARSGADLKAAISFHGLLDAPDLPKKKIKAKVLAAHGWDDPMAKPDSVMALAKELTEAGCDWQILALGGTSHAFSVPGAANKELGLMYNEISASRSWNNAFALLDEVFALHGTV